MNSKQIINEIVTASLVYVPKIIIAIIIWLIGSWVIKILTHGFNQMLDKRRLDPTLKPFVKALISLLLKVLLIISVLSTIGIQMTSFVAIIGSAGLAIGLALSGTLQNFAGSLIILLFKPIRLEIS